jgi:signal peptidase I
MNENPPREAGIPFALVRPFDFPACRGAEAGLCSPEAPSRAAEAGFGRGADTGTLSEGDGMSSSAKIVKKKSKFREWVEIIVTALALALVVRTFIIQSYHIPSGSMEKTLLPGDFLFANKFIYGAKVPFVDASMPKVRDPRPGDVVIFKFPGDRRTDYIKRCIAVPGQTVELRGTHLFIDGVEKQESYAYYDPALESSARDFGPYTVPKGCFIAFGDNRNNSFDSRYWGPVDRKLLRGEALFIYFSVDIGNRRIRFSRIGRIIH